MCKSFSRVYSRKWDYWVGGCAHFQLYQLPSSSPKWWYQQYFLRFSFFFFLFPSTVPTHYNCPPLFSITTLGPSVPTHRNSPPPALTFPPPPASAPKQKPKNWSGVRAREELSQTETRPQHHRGVGGGGKKFWNQHMVIICVESDRWWQVTYVIVRCCQGTAGLQKLSIYFFQVGHGRTVGQFSKNSFRTKGIQIWKIPPYGWTVGRHRPSSHLQEGAENCWPPSPMWATGS